MKFSEKCLKKDKEVCLSKWGKLSGDPVRDTCLLISKYKKEDYVIFVSRFAFDSLFNYISLTGMQDFFLVLVKDYRGIEKLVNNKLRVIDSNIRFCGIGKDKIEYWGYV